MIKCTSGELISLTFLTIRDGRARPFFCADSLRCRRNGRGVRRWAALCCVGGDRRFAQFAAQVRMGCAAGCDGRYGIAACAWLCAACMAVVRHGVRLCGIRQAVCARRRYAVYRRGRIAQFAAWAYAKKRATRPACVRICGAKLAAAGSAARTVCFFSRCKCAAHLSARAATVRATKLDVRVQFVL